MPGHENVDEADDRLHHEPQLDVARAVLVRHSEIGHEREDEGQGARESVGTAGEEDARREGPLQEYTKISAARVTRATDTAAILVAASAEAIAARVHAAAEGLIASLADRVAGLAAPSAARVDAIAERVACLAEQLARLDEDPCTEDRCHGPRGLSTNPV